MKHLLLGVCVLIGMGAGTAHAGFKTGQAVVIVPSSMLANGELGYVRNTADGTQYIGCSLYGSGAATCYAQNLAGTYVSCYTTNVNHLNAISALNGDSYLIFYWNTAGNCTNITVQNSSTSAPKGP